MKTFQSIQMRLAGGRLGRMALHLICLCQDGKFQWHLRGIVRELPNTARLAQSLRSRWARHTHPNLDSSAFAKTVEAIHDTVFLTKPVKSAG